MSNEKVNEALAKGREIYNKGNELMDKVPVLKNPLNKKIAWGVLCLVFLLAIGRIFGCWGGFDASARLLDGCKAYIEKQYGEGTLQRFEVEEVQVDGNRAVLKAAVKIHAEPSIAPVSDGFDAVGTAVFLLEEKEDVVYVVDFRLE